MESDQKILPKAKGLNHKYQLQMR